MKTPTRKPTLETVSLFLIKPLDQFRKHFDDIDKLKEDILSTGGIKQPIGLNEKYEIIWGERRYRAYLELSKLHPKWGAIPALVQRYDSREQEVFAGIIENISRRSYLPSEEFLALAWVKAHSIKLNAISPTGRPRKLSLGEQVEHDKKSFAQMISEITGEPESSIARKTRLGVLGDTSTLNAIDSGSITQTQAVQIISLPKDIQAMVVPVVRELTIQETKSVVRDVAAQIKDRPDYKITDIQPICPERKFRGVNTDTWMRQFGNEMDLFSKKLRLAIDSELWTQSAMGEAFRKDVESLFAHLAESERLFKGVKTLAE